jgi:hypothetical protein
LKIVVPNPDSCLSAINVDVEGLRRSDLLHAQTQVLLRAHIMGRPRSLSRSRVKVPMKCDDC